MIAPAPIPPPLRADLTVLIVDDDRVVGRALQRLCTRQGMRVALVHSAAEALAQTSRFAAVVLDLHLPDGSGAHLAQRFLSEGRAGAVVYYSGSREPAEIAAAERLGPVISKAQPASDVVAWLLAEAARLRA